MLCLKFTEVVIYEGVKVVRPVRGQSWYNNKEMKFFYTYVLFSKKDKKFYTGWTPLEPFKLI